MTSTMDCRTCINYTGCSHLFKIFCHTKMLQRGANNFKQETKENLSLHLWKQVEYQMKLSQYQYITASNRHKWFPNPTLGIISSFFFFLLFQVFG